MIDYVCENPEGCRPRVAKRFTSSSGEEFRAEVLPQQEQERSELSDDQVQQHIDNLLSYLKGRAASSSVIARDEPLGSEPWCIRGWDEVEWAREQIFLWWEYLYYRDETAHDHGDGDA